MGFNYLRTEVYSCANNFKNVTVFLKGFILGVKV